MINFINNFYGSVKSLSNPFIKKKPEVFLLTCIGTDWDENLPAHFVEHYLKLGIAAKNFLVILHSHGRDNLRKAVNILAEYGITAKMTWRGEYSDPVARKHLTRIQKEHVRNHDWVIKADLDEFHEYPDDLIPFLKDCDKNKINCVKSFLVDHVSADGGCPAIQSVSEKSIWEQYPKMADVVGEIKKGCLTKIMACKGYYLPSKGDHNIPHRARRWQKARPYKILPDFNFKTKELPFQERLTLNTVVHHFGWTLDTMLKYEVRSPHERKLGLGCWQESDQFMVHIKKHGKINLPLHDMVPRKQPKMIKYQNTIILETAESHS